MKTVTLTSEEFDKISALYPKLHGVFQSLEGFVNEPLLKEMNDIKTSFAEIFQSFWDMEEEEFDKNMDALAEIQEANNLSTIWSTEIKASEINKKTPYKVKNISYKDLNIQFKKEKRMTWLEMWQAANDLILKSQDTHHIFVEDFSPRKDKPGYFELITGS